MRSAVVIGLLFLVIAAPARAQESIAAPVVYTPAACSNPPFADIPTNHPYCPWIQQLRNDQISEGCSDGLFCPDEPVTRKQLAMLLEKAMRGSGGWETWRGMYVRTRIVSPVPGNPLAAGVRLASMVHSIPDSSSSNPYLVIVEPGEYDLDDQKLFMPPYVTLRGAGRGHTMITGRVSGGAIQGAAGTLIESLTVENLNPPATQAIGIDFPAGSSGTVRFVEALGYSGLTTSIGIRCLDDCTIEDSEARANSAPNSNDGIFVGGSTTFARLLRVRAFGDNGTDAHGVNVVSANATIEGGLLQGRDADRNAGLMVSGASAEVEAREFVAIGNGFQSTDISAGARLQSAAVLTIENGHLESGSGGWRYGFYCTDGTASIHNSRLIGPNGTVFGAPDCTIDVATSQLAGAAVDENGGTVRCALNYSENLNVPATTGCF